MWIKGKYIKLPLLRWSYGDKEEEKEEEKRRSQLKYNSEYIYIEWTLNNLQFYKVKNNWCGVFENWMQP